MVQVCGILVVSEARYAGLGQGWIKILGFPGSTFSGGLWLLQLIT